MTEQRLQNAFTDVDKSNMPQRRVQYLDFQRTIAFTQMYKQRARTLLDVQPGHLVLDAGCGTGQDACETARLVGSSGHVIGFDFSQVMLDTARQRAQDTVLPISFQQGDIHHLPFAAGYFDRCYADKTFQHVADPGQALSELVRVLKPGGRLVSVDPDHDTMVLASPYPELTHRFLRFSRSGMRQPDIAHQAYAFFKDAGFIDVTVEPLTWIQTDYEAIREFVPYAENMRFAQKQGAFTGAEADQWIAAFEESVRTGRFLRAVTYFITVGNKPAS